MKPNFQNGRVTLLPQDSEGIKPEGGNDNRPYYVEVDYLVRDCKYTETGTIEELNPDYKDPSDPDYDPNDPNQQDQYIYREVTETVGVKDTASLQAWLADVENAGFKLKKEKSNYQ